METVIFVFMLFFSSCLYSQYLNPADFSSLGTFNPASNVTINMTTRSMSGGATATGVMSGTILVFTFDSFTLASGISISFTNVEDNDDKIAFLSKGSMTITGNIYANASTSTPGPGGRRGGIGTPDVSLSPEVGMGTGGGQINYDGGNDDGGGGGGFGGAGGKHGYNAPGGVAYGDLSVALDGGSGGGRSMYDRSDGYGGGGGGALELGALGTLTLNSGCNIEAKGAAGANADITMCGQDGDGGGSGGGILIHANVITFNSGANVNANGGNGGYGDDDGTYCYSSPGYTGDGGSAGSGGGGRIRFAYYASGTNNGTATANAGSVDPTESPAGVAGSAGVIQFVQDNDVPQPVPEINVKGNNTSIVDGDDSPSTDDHTNFGSANVTGGTVVRTFTIENTGSGTLSLTGSSPYVAISGANADDFSITATPSNSIAASSSTTFQVTFNPSGAGTRTASLSIANNDSNENPYNFDIQGTGTAAITFADGSAFTPTVIGGSDRAIGRFSLTGDGAGANLTAAAIKLNGTRTGMSNFKLWRSTDASFDAGSDTQLGSTVTADPGDGFSVSFSSFTGAIGTSATYFFLTADVAAGATGVVQGVIVANGNLTLSNGTLSGSINNDPLSNGDVSLPVELAFFSATIQGNAVVLNWQTESETDNLGFILERVEENGAWQQITSYKTESALKGQGNSSSTINYSYTDNTVYAGMEYRYRLADVNTAGTVTMHSPISVTMTALPQTT